MKMRSEWTESHLKPSAVEWETELQGHREAGVVYLTYFSRLAYIHVITIESENSRADICFLLVSRLF